MNDLVFLDIDGVLNSTRYHTANNPLPLGQAGAIDPAACALVNQIVTRPSVRVVLSTSWRMQGVDIVGRMLRERGFRGSIIGATPTLARRPRSHEIDAWLEQACVLGFDWRRFLVLDDQADAFDRNGLFGSHGHFVNTNHIDGITEEGIHIANVWLDRGERLTRVVRAEATA